MKLPKAKTILAFLLSKGWKVDKETEAFFYLAPPPGIKFRKDFRWKIPVTDEPDLEYSEYVTRITFGIAALYSLDKLDLLYAFTKDYAEVEDDLNAMAITPEPIKPVAYAS